MARYYDQMTILGGNSNLELTREICAYVDIPPGRADVFKFSNGNIFVRVGESVRENDVFVVQSFSNPVSDSIMEMLIMIDTLKRASAGRITAVIPYFGYGRTDKKDQPRVPITARLLADMIGVAGADRVLTIDLHAGQIQGFFNIPVDHLYAAPVMLDEIRARFTERVVVVSPDAGGTERARAFAKRLDAGLAIIDKRRSGPNVSEVMHIIGDVAGEVCMIVDDMIDTAGTLCQAAKALKEKGAREIYACATHAVLSGPALERINESCLEEVVVTNSIPLDDKVKACPKLRVLSVAELLAEAIRRINGDESVSSLFV
jgi:ribose-phosphate pyrophosphokinase